VLGLGHAAVADELIYANNAGSHDYVWQLDLTTDTLAKQIDTGLSANGRGVVDVNNILYITTASTGNVYSYNISTGTVATAFTVSGASGLASITYTGSDFWIGDYSGTDRAYLYTPTGTLLKTISLTNCTGFCDGLTYLPVNGGELISNRADGFDRDSIYDVYSTSGTLIKAGFIDTTSLGSMGCVHTTGIAWDGTNYFVSCLDDPTPTVAKYGLNGNFLALIPLTNPNGFDNGGFGPTMEGLSANFAITIPTPEPASFALIGVGLAAVFILRKKLRAPRAPSA
jgi:outer membrane protein assembly factor BamB